MQTLRLRWWSSPLKEGDFLHCHSEGNKGGQALPSLHKVLFTINMFLHELKGVSFYGVKAPT